MQLHDHIAKQPSVGGVKRSSSSCSAFTLVEIALSIAVLAIGLLGTLVLFPVGLDATRTASDNTEMATIAAEYISMYQQTALTNANYVSLGLNQDVLSQSDSGVLTNSLDNGSFCLSRIVVTNTGIPQIQYDIPPYNPGPATNTISRVIIDLWRPGGNTNTYVTEVARYALP